MQTLPLALRCALAVAALLCSTSGPIMAQAPLTLRGHEGCSNALAFSPDSRILVTVGNDNQVILWDLLAGRKRATFRGDRAYHTETVAFSPKGDLLATNGDDGMVILWDSRTGQPRRRLPGHKGSILSVAFSPDGKLLASSNPGMAVRLWDVASGKQMRAWEGHPRGIRTVAFSPDGKTLATMGCMDNTLCLWDVITGKLKRALRPHKDFGGYFAFAPDGKTLATTGTILSDKVVSPFPGATVQDVLGGELKLWDAATGKELRTIKSKKNFEPLAFSPDGKLLATGGTDGVVRLWDPVTGKERAALGKHASDVSAVAFSPNGKLLASASRAPKTAGEVGEIKVWDLSSVLKPLRTRSVPAPTAGK